jgi:hypothetical protein
VRRGCSFPPRMIAVDHLQGVAVPPRRGIAGEKKRSRWPCCSRVGRTRWMAGVTQIL